jgi:hypothetical protein
VFFIPATTAFHSTKMTGELAGAPESDVYLCSSAVAAVLAEQGRHPVWKGATVRTPPCLEEPDEYPDPETNARS